jgi:hypothetical protein
MIDQSHQSYLLRLWRDHAGAPWRATLIDVTRSDERSHFATLEALFAFLATQANEPTEPERHHNARDDDTPSDSTKGGETDHGKGLHCTPDNA